MKYVVTWQIKDVISPLSQGLWISNLAGWWLRLKGPNPQSHVTHWSKGVWQIKGIISPLSQGLWTPNLAGWWLRMRECHPQTHPTNQPHGHVTSQRRYISTFTRPIDPKLSRILVILWLLQQRFAQRQIGWSKYNLISNLLCQRKF